MSLFYCFRSPPNCWTLQLSASHRPLTSSYASTSHLSSPRPRTVSLFFKDLLKHFLPLAFPQKTDWPQPSDTTSGTLQRKYFPKMKPLLSEWTPCDWLREDPASSKSRRATPGKPGRRGGARVPPLFSLLAAQCSSTNIPTADGNTSKATSGVTPPYPSPSLSHSTKDVTCSPKPLSSHQLWTRPWKVHEVVTTPRKQQGTDTREARSTLFFHYIDKHITESRSSFPAKGLLPLFTRSPIPHPTP